MMERDTSIRHALAEAIRGFAITLWKDRIYPRGRLSHFVVSYRVGTCYYACIRQGRRDARWAMGWFTRWSDDQA